MKMSVARVLIEYLKQTRVNCLFGLIGHSLFDITDALYSEPELKYVPVQHELSAAYAAEAYAKGTRRLGVCLASSGAGATNLLTGIAQAYKESSPVIAIAADVSGEVAGKGTSSWHEIPQQEIFRPITKMSATLRRGEDILDLLTEAVRQATAGKKGPVYLGIPRDLQSQEIEVPAPPWDACPSPAEKLDSSLIEKAVEELWRATSPTIIAGGGVYWSQGEGELQGLAELLSAPFGTTPSHKGLVSEDHPLSLGVLGSGAFPFANKACMESDLILAVGTTFSEALTLGYGNRVIPRAAKIIQVDVDPIEIGKIYPVKIGIPGDAKAVLGEMISRLNKKMGSKRTTSRRMERIAREKGEWREEMARRAQPVDAPVNQWHLYGALREAIHKDTVVVGEGGTQELLRRFIASSKVYQSGDFRAIGHGLPTAMGLKFAFPERQVVCVSGDGSFMMEMQELATLAALNIPIAIIIVHNSAYGNMKRDQLKRYGGRVIGTDLYLPDLCALASSFGLPAERVEKPPELLGAMKKVMAAGKPALLDVWCPIEEV